MIAKGKAKQSIKAAPYLVAGLIYIVVFTVLPILYTVWISFTNKTVYTKDGESSFVGLANFKEVFNGPFKDVFFPVFGWTLLFAVISTLGCFLVGLILAMLLNNPNIKEKGIYKAILILPWALPVTVAVLSWQGLFNGTYGAINNILINMHIISNPIPWLTDPFWAKAAIIIANIWLGFPYMMNVCIGGLSAIPDSYYEAADVDGASTWIKFTRITLPSLTRTAYPLLITSFAFNFNNFNSAFLITEGGPARLSTQFAGYTDILASVNYKLSTQFGRIDIASTISIIIFVILAVLSYFQMRVSGQFKEVD
ncbi:MULTISPECIES: sugar ABC transporter permease [Clostridium]|uniref:Maltose/maltodextrin transport system permease protein n=1 Tax=Clostridium cibarium TaxID=2762247 RepID=A0ABR8PUI6_9CLOT|nr:MULTISPECIES: sugar ABC transporter permease [Clostridium]MBD7911835.1 sugar ABC transporter permease [Clostridium cibarium]